MPKIVDHDQRRAEIGAAVRRLLLREGLSGATVRGVVAESGMSSGAIRHYFPRHEELIQFAAAGITERVTQRVHDAFNRTHRTPRSRVLDVLEQFLPTDPERAMELKVFTQLVARADGAVWSRSSWSGIRRTTRACVLLLADRLAVSVTDAPLRPARLERLAERLHLVVDGISAQTTYYPALLSAADLRAILARSVDDVITELGSAPDQGRPRSGS